MAVEWNIFLRNNFGWELTKKNVTPILKYKRERHQIRVLLQTTFTSHPLNVVSYWNVDLVLSEEEPHNVRLNPTDVQRVVIGWVADPFRLPHWHSCLRMSGGQKLRRYLLLTCGLPLRIIAHRALYLISVLVILVFPEYKRRGPVFGLCIRALWWILAFGNNSQCELKKANPIYRGKPSD